MKKTIALAAMFSLFALVAPVLAQDTEPGGNPPPAPVDCKDLKGKEKKECKKAQKDKKDKK